MQHYVLQDFYKNPAQTKQRDRTKDGVTIDAHDAFDATTQLLGDQHAIQTCLSLNLC